MTAAERLRVQLLGPVRAWRGEGEVALGPARSRALFAVLALAGRMVRRDELIDDVWGAAAPATAVGNIYTYVSGLRRGLGRELLVSGPTGYELRLHREDLDSGRFAGLCTQAADLREAGRLAEAVAVLDEALGLWHGEAFAGLTGHHLELQRARLDERRLDAVELRARLRVELGDDSVVAELAGLVRTEPLHEPLHELLVLALHRAGRRDDAVAAFHAARRVLRTELGIEPGPALTDLYERVRYGGGLVPSALPAPVVEVVVRDRPLVGRDAEVRDLRALVGRGGAVWIEGEPGSGKTELLTAAFADAGRRDCQLAWGIADELDRYRPVAVLSRALDLDTEAPDRILGHLTTACAGAPVVLIVDNLQWADPDTVLLWERLVVATRRMPLLLVAAARPDGPGAELAGARRAVRARRGRLIQLQPLPPDAVERLVAELAGTQLGPELAALLPVANGNPKRARELATELLRRGAVRLVEGRAELADPVPPEASRALLAAARATVDVLPPAAQEVLRTAALLGTRFAVNDVVAVTDGAPLRVVADLEPALAGNVIVDAGTELEFRHPLLRQALYESIPAPARAALHRHTAEVLDQGGGSVARVAEQLAAAAPAADGWTVSWLVAHHAEVVRDVPRIAGDLLDRALGAADRAQREQLLIASVRLGFRNGRAPVEEARQALGLARDPADRAELNHILAVLAFRGGDTPTAVRILTEALDDPEIPELWRSRHKFQLAWFDRGSLDDLDRAEAAAAASHARALAANKPHESASALQTQWLTNSIRRDHERALEYVDRALETLQDAAPQSTALHLDLLENRVFTLQNLDRLDEAERTLREADLFALGHRLPSGLTVATAVQDYWRGRWDAALAGINTITNDADLTLRGVREPVAIAMLANGVAALIAARRHDTVLARGQVGSVGLDPASDAERESNDFLLAAQATLAEQRGQPAEALRIFAPLLEPGYAPMLLRHQWLPDITRLALAIGDRDLAERAVSCCDEEAGREVRPARAASAAARCRALLTTDPEPALLATDQYRKVGRTVELAAGLEDAAVLLAANRRPHESTRTGAEAIELYTALGAAWDLHRLRHRLAEYGVNPE